jgi:hypothetical protein
MSRRGALFDPVPFYPCLALIRIPANPRVELDSSDIRDEFGSGFFITGNGVVLTAVHNVEWLRPEGYSYRPPRLLPRVWVCTYDESDRDWTFRQRVHVEPRLFDLSSVSMWPSFACPRWT